MSAGHLACPGCNGFGTTAMRLPTGGRLVAACRSCGGTGMAEALPVHILRDLETCLGKRVYATRGRAARAISELRKRGFPVDHPYKCQVCGGWHLTCRRGRK